MSLRSQSNKVPYNDLKEFTEQGNLALSYPAFTSGIVHTAFKSMPLVEQALVRDSQSLKQCERLFIESPDAEDLDHGDEDEAEWVKKCGALVKVLDALATHEHLRSFSWTWKPGYMDCGQPEIPVDVFKALVKSAATLESLNIDFTCADLGQSWPSWEAFPSDKYKSLRHLRLGLGNAHDGDGARLRRMLAALTELQSLDLRFTLCCGLREFALSSHHPGLLSFSLYTAKLPNKCADDEPTTKDFFKRHPLIQYLNLRYSGRAEGSDFEGDDMEWSGEEMSDGEEGRQAGPEQTKKTAPATAQDLPSDAAAHEQPVFDGIFEFDEGDLPNLQVLSVDDEVLNIVPTMRVLAQRPLAALEVSIIFPSDTDKLQVINPGVKCLHLDFHSFFSGNERTRTQTEVLPPVLKDMSSLTELRITYNTSIPHQFDYSDEEDDESEEYMAQIEKEMGPEALAEYKEYLASKGQAESMLEMEDGSQSDEDGHENQASKKPYSGSELVELLGSLPAGSLPSLTALTIEDAKIEPLDADLITNFPCKLPALRYLGWNTRGFDEEKKTLYELVRHEDGRISLREVKPLWTPPNRDGRHIWTDDNVLDQFGEVSHNW